MKRLPKIPKSVYSTLGAIPVLRVQGLTDAEGKPCDDLGQWDGKARTISVLSDMSPIAAWQVLLHERTHSWLTGAGITIPAPYEEIVCDIVATAILAEMLNR